MRTLATLAALAGATAMTVQAAIPPAPETPKKPVTNTYHGVAVVDDYRWLEKPGDPAVRKWTDAQNAHTRAFLDAIPARAAIAARLKAIQSAKSASYYSLARRGPTLFAMKHQPPKQQDFLVTLASTESTASERVVVDPNAIDAKGGTAIDFFVPSRDGKRVAVCMSKDGSEDGTVTVFEVATGKPTGDDIPRVNYPTGGGSVAWKGDGSGFFYTRYPAEGEREPEELHFHQEVWFHHLGQPLSEDAYALGGDFPRIAETELRASDDGQYILATVSNGDGGEYAHYVLNPSGWWAQFSSFEDGITQAAFGPDNTLYLLSHKDAPKGKVLRVLLPATDLSDATLVIEQGPDAIMDVTPTANRLYVTYVSGGPSALKAFDLSGKPIGPVGTLPVSSVGGVIAMGNDTILFRNASFTQPPAWYRYGASTPKPVRTALFRRSPVTFDDVDVTRAFAVSKDGTKVPMTIVMKKGTALNGANPTLLTAYGGYGVIEAPSYDPNLRVWLDAGGVFVDANLRGGGEYGEEWHRAGYLTKKQNVFDDFLAAAQYLIQKKITSPAKLAIEGGSNGGLLMGAAFTQRPELFRAVVSHVGVYDVLREELTPNGAFNTTEFGTVADPDQFKAMYAYSPYHAVKDGAQYPAILLPAGENDGRVDPSNSRKMAARLQASGTKRPVLLRTSATSGHGIGMALDESIALDADVYAFLFQELGMTAEPRKP
ncbi:MAG TPA: prolyl oligopeptidase family serine peptidase [Armatimonadota bacterium]